MRARKVAWTGAAISAAITGIIGLVAALFPDAWLHLFSREEQVVRIGSAYLIRVAPFYVFTGLGMALYFASQGAGRVTWPFAAGVARLSIVLVLGWYWIHVAHGSLAGLFWVIALSQIAFGTINVFAMANRLTFKSPVTGHGDGSLVRRSLYLCRLDFCCLRPANRLGKFITLEGEKYYRDKTPIRANPHVDWLPDQGSNLGPAD